MTKVMYLHGLEGNANGTKGLYCQIQYNAVAPQMPATLESLMRNRKDCIKNCYQIAKEAVEIHKPDLIIGSSFGGGITITLMQNNVHKGKAILLAPAGVKYGLSTHIPQGNQVVIIHDRSDEIVPYQDSVLIESMNDNSTLITTTGGHRLINLTTDGLLDYVVKTMLLA
jgi:alpha/beta superfamily hydrolase